MSKKRKIVYVLIGLLLLVFSTISVVYASGIDDKYNNIEQYKSYMLDSNWVFANTSVMMNYLANFLFGLSKAIASMTDFFIKALYQNNGIDSIVDVVSDTSAAIYNNIFGKYGVLLFLIAMLSASIKYLMSANKGIKDILQVVLLVGICTLWISNAGVIIKGANDISNDIQTTIATSGDKLLGDGEKLDGKDMLRQKFFEQAVEQPFLIMNFNELDKEKVNSNSNFKGEDGKSRVDSLIIQRDKEKEQDYLKEHEFDKEKKLDDKKKNKQNYYISDEVVTHKLTVAFLSLIMNLILMLPFNLISMLNFMIQIQIIFYFFIIPFALLLSYIGFLKTSYIKVFKNLFSLFVMKAMLGLVVLFVSLVMNLTKKIMQGVEASPITIYITSIVLLVLALYMMWKNRKEIVSTLLSGDVSNFTSKFDTSKYRNNDRDNKEKNRKKEKYEYGERPLKRNSDNSRTGETSSSPNVRDKYDYNNQERTEQKVDTTNNLEDSKNDNKEVKDDVTVPKKHIPKEENQEKRTPQVKEENQEKRTPQIKEENQEKRTPQVKEENQEKRTSQVNRENQEKRTPQQNSFKDEIRKNELI